MFLPNPDQLGVPCTSDVMSPPAMGANRRQAAMAPVHIDPDTTTLRPCVIGHDRDGYPIWTSAGGRGNNHGIGGIDFLVDDKDGDDPDDFDEDEADDDPEDDDGYEIDDRDDDEEDERDEDDPDARQRARRDGRESRWQPPSRAEWEKVQAALRRNNADHRRNRAARKIMERLGVKDDGELADFLIDRGIDPDTGDPLGGSDRQSGGQESGTAEQLDGDGQPHDRQAVIAERRRAEQRGAEREQQRWRPAVIQFAAADALRDAGFSGGNLASVLRLLDIDDVEVEFTDGEPVVYGLDDQVAKLKDDLPELFRPRRPRTEDDEPPRRRPEGGRRVTGTTGVRQVDGGDRPRPPAKKMGWLEKTDRMMQGLSPEPRSRRR